MKLSGILVCFGPVLILVDNTLVDYIDEACYGSNGFIDSLQPQCPVANQVIYPLDVYTYAKQIVTGCPWISDFSNRNETYCCRYVNETEDCGMRYYGNNLGLEHYKPFTGRDTGLIQVAWNDTINVCNQSIYFERTHFMRLTYNCINSSQIGSVCNSSLTGNPLFLWNDGYPYSDGGCSSTSGCKCTIQSSGGSTIQIDALDLRFAENDTSGDCAQRLFITDGVLSSDVACDDDNLFERRSLFTSSSDSLQLRYDNTYNGDSGNFWISLEATDSSETLTVTCSQSDVNTEYSCGDNFTIITPFTITSSTDIAPTSATTDVLVTPASTETDIAPTGTATNIAITSTDITTVSTTTDMQSSISSLDTLASAISSTTSLTNTLSLATTSYYTATSLSDITPTASSYVYYSATSSSAAPVINTQSSLGENSSASKGPIIGIIIGVVVAAAAGLLVAYGIYRKKCKGNHKVDDYSKYFDDDSDGMITSRPPELPRIGTGFGRFD